jgi:hypothetical protein
MYMSCSAARESGDSGEPSLAGRGVGGVGCLGGNGRFQQWHNLADVVGGDGQRLSGENRGGGVLGACAFGPRPAQHVGLAEIRCPVGVVGDVDVAGECLLGQLGRVDRGDLLAAGVDEQLRNEFGDLLDS